jgi:hypothetical protein
MSLCCLFYIWLFWKVIRRMEADFYLDTVVGIGNENRILVWVSNHRKIMRRCTSPGWLEDGQINLSFLFHFAICLNASFEHSGIISLVVYSVWWCQVFCLLFRLTVPHSARTTVGFPMLLVSRKSVFSWRILC